MEVFRATINLKEVIPDIIKTAALIRLHNYNSHTYEYEFEYALRRPVKEKLVFSEGDIKRMNYKWLD